MDAACSSETHVNYIGLYGVKIVFFTKKNMIRDNMFNNNT
jgi:hypothetical protein